MKLAGKTWKELNWLAQDRVGRRRFFDQCLMLQWERRGVSQSVGAGRGGAGWAGPGRAGPGRQAGRQAGRQSVRQAVCLSVGAGRGGAGRAGRQAGRQAVCLSGGDGDGHCVWLQVGSGTPKIDPRSRRSTTCWKTCLRNPASARVMRLHFPFVCFHFCSFCSFCLSFLSAFLFRFLFASYQM